MLNSSTRSVQKKSLEESKSEAHNQENEQEAPLRADIQQYKHPQ
jgi:hypothetical protein